MPNLFVVSEQHTAASLAAALLPSRIAAADRTAALAELRAANPSVDLDHLRPGTVLVVPATIERLRRGAADDPAGDAADAVLAEVREALAALAAAAEQAASDAQAQRKATYELLDSPAVAGLGHDELLARNTKALRETLAADETAAAEQSTALRESLKAWQADLKQLRGLL